MSIFAKIVTGIFVKKSEKELKAIHEKMIDETHGKMQARVKSGQRFDANNKIPSSLIPHFE